MREPAGTETPDFGELARQQLPRLYSIARRLVGDDAEDAVQDCLLKAFQRYGGSGSPAQAGMAGEHPGELLP